MFDLPKPLAAMLLIAQCRIDSNREYSIMRHFFLILTLALSFHASAQDPLVFAATLDKFIVNKSADLAAAPPPPDGPETPPPVVNPDILDRLNVDFDINAETTDLLGEQIDLNSGSVDGTLVA